MKVFPASLCFAVLLALPGAAQTTASAAHPATGTPADEQIFTALLRQVAAAVQQRDTAAVGRLLAAECRH